MRRIRGGDGHREHDAGRTTVARDLDRGSRGAPGRNAVVDDHDHATLEGHRSTTIAISGGPPLDLGALGCFDGRAAVGP